MVDVLFITFDPIGACVETGLPIVVVCSIESSDGSVASRLWKEVRELHRESSDGAVKVWYCPPLVEFELVIDGCPCCACVFAVLLLAFEKH